VWASWKKTGVGLHARKARRVKVIDLELNDSRSPLLSVHAKGVLILPFGDELRRKARKGKGKRGAGQNNFD